MPVTTRDIRDKVFRNSGRGYNKDDVDSFLDEIIDEMNLLCSKIDSLEMHVEAEQAKMKSISTASKSAEQIMSDAKAYSQQIVKEAKDLAESIVKEAKDKAEQLVKNASLEKKPFDSAEDWHGYPGFEDDLQAITGQPPHDDPSKGNEPQQPQAKKTDGFSFDDLDFEKDLSSSKENIREALLTDLGLEGKAAEEEPEDPPKAQEEAPAKKSTAYREPFNGIDQDDYYNLLYGPGPASKLDISEVGKANSTPIQGQPQPIKEAPRVVSDQEEDKRMPQPAQPSKREPIPFPGASAEMQEERPRPRSFSLTSKTVAGINDGTENPSHRRKLEDLYDDETDGAKSGRGDVHFALMPLEIEERKPLQRYSSNLDGFAHLRDDSDMGYASEKFRSKK